MPQASELPQPPSIPPKLRLSRKQWIGFPVMLAIPIITLFGLLGERTALARVKSASLDVAVSYPERFRYRQVQPLHLWVRNLSTQPLDTITVTFDTAYISRFSSVRFDPPAKKAYAVELTDVRPMESRFVAVELWGQDYGMHRGTIVARTGTDSAVVHARTFVFP
jgi:hypothetical protein